MIKHYEPNSKGKDYVVGDIHGAFSKLEAQLLGMNFTPATDRLFSVGDLVDRGKESHRVLEWLDRPWFIPVLGNHEEFITKNLVQDHLANGGEWFYLLPASTQEVIRQYLLELPIKIKIGDIGIVHADWDYDHLWNRRRYYAYKNGVKMGGEVDPNPEPMFDGFMCERANGYPNVEDCRVVVVGHTPMSEAPVWLGNVLYLDNAAWCTDRPFNIIDLSTL